MTQSIYRTNGTDTAYKTPYGWESYYTGDAIEYADEAAADAAISSLPNAPAGYTYGKSNPPGGPKRPRP